MLPIAVPRIVLVSGSHTAGRRRLAADVANSITATLLSSDDLAGAVGEAATLDGILVVLASRQLERDHSVVIDYSAPVDDIASVLETVALRNGAKFAPVSCFDSTDENDVIDTRSEFEIEQAMIEAEVEGSLSIAGGWGFGITVDTSRAGDEPLRDVIAYLQHLDGLPLQVAEGCKFCDHDQIRRRAVSVLQNEWCMFSAEKIDGRMVGAVTPIRHVPTVFDLTASEWAATGALLRAGLRHLDKEVQPDSFIVGWNTKPVTAGQTPHAQLRIVPYFAPAAAAPTAPSPVAAAVPAPPSAPFVAPSGGASAVGSMPPPVLVGVAGNPTAHS